MIKKGDRIKGFQFDKDNSARVGWEERMSKYVGVEGIVHKIAEGPHDVGSRIEIRFTREWDGNYSNELNKSWSNTIAMMYPLAECLQILREEKLKEIGI
jgi:hypothetical protein